MPKPAQERIGRGPFGALLILFSLLVGSGGAAYAGADVRQSARLSPSRQSAPVAFLPSGNRNALEDAARAAGGDPAVALSQPRIAAKPPWARPAADPPGGHQAELPGTVHPSHRARAPPAA